MKIKTILILLFIFITPILGGVIGNGYTLIMNGIYQNNFRTMEHCEAYKYLFYKDSPNVKCVRSR